MLHDINAAVNEWSRNFALITCYINENLNITRTLPDALHKCEVGYATKNMRPAQRGTLGVYVNNVNLAMRMRFTFLK